MILGLQSVDGAMAFNPPSDSVLHAGDCLIALGADDLKKLEALAGV